MLRPAISQPFAILRLRSARRSSAPEAKGAEEAEDVKEVKEAENVKEENKKGHPY